MTRAIKYGRSWLTLGIGLLSLLIGCTGGSSPQSPSGVPDIEDGYSSPMLSDSKEKGDDIASVTGDTAKTPLHDSDNGEILNDAAADNDVSEDDQAQTEIPDSLVPKDTVQPMDTLDTTKEGEDTDPGLDRSSGSLAPTGGRASGRSGLVDCRSFPGGLGYADAAGQLAGLLAQPRRAGGPLDRVCRRRAH